MDMLKSLGTELKVGMFAIVALVTLGYMFFVLSPDAFEHKSYNHYYTVLRNAAGIVAKTHVKTSGVTVGKVASVTLQRGRTRVDFEVDAQVQIPQGSHIEIRSVGLLGDKHLEVVTPEEEAATEEEEGQAPPPAQAVPANVQYIADGGYIPQSQKSVDMEALIALVGDVAKDVKKVTGSLADVLGTKKGEQSIAKILDNIEVTTTDIRASTKTLREVIGDRKSDLNDIVTDVHSGVHDLRKFAANLKDVLNEQNKQRIDRILASFDATMVDVKGSAHNINLISEKVEKGQGTIGKLVNDDSTLTEIEGAIKDIRKVIAPATKLVTTVDYHGELRRNDTTQHFFNVLLQTRPDRFYLLGMTDTTYDHEDTTTTTTQDGNKTIEKKTIKRDRAIRFNAQFGKRWYWLAGRFGLFESTGGLAGDLYFFNDRLRFTLEAFDWDTNSNAVRRTAHIKTYASVLFYNHIYALAGIDDPTRTDPATGKVNKQLNWMFGGGLTFTDDDLKSLIGAAALAAP